MVTSLSYLILALAAASLVVGIFLAIRLKTVLYLLQQPVVKKMSTQLRLKPVKLDEVMGRGGREGRPEGGRPEGRGEGRPEGRGPRPEGGRRDDRGPRGDRPEGDRGPRRDDRGPRPERTEGGRPQRAEGDRGPRRDDRGPRPERAEGDRGPRREDRNDRGPRPERTEGDRPRREDRPERSEGGREDRPRRDDRGPRGDRPERTEGDRAPRREFSETRDFAPAPQAEFAAPAAESAPLSPRRPLFADTAEVRSEIAPVRENPIAESFVGSNNDDLQHGRRTTLKKKPRFDITEEDLKTEA